LTVSVERLAREFYFPEAVDSTAAKTFKKSAFPRHFHRTAGLDGPPDAERVWAAAWLEGMAAD
jgi:hypothetical protein